MFNQSSHHVKSAGAQKYKLGQTALFFYPHETHFRANPILLLRRICLRRSVMVSIMGIVALGSLCVCFGLSGGKH